MTKTDLRRQALRAAARIHEHLIGPARLNQLVELPTATWQDLLQTDARLRLARQRRWRVAGEQLVTDLDYQARRMVRELETYLQALPALLPAERIAKPSDIAADLLALAGEFDEVQIDLSERQVTVLTPSITLEELELGPFRIELHWERIGIQRAYDLAAEEPYYPNGDEETTHPHVRGKTLCEGDGAKPIKAALSEGRLLDFFLLVRQILRNLQPGQRLRGAGPLARRGVLSIAASGWSRRTTAAATAAMSRCAAAVPRGAAAATAMPVANAWAAVPNAAGTSVTLAWNPRPRPPQGSAQPAWRRNMLKKMLRTMPSLRLTPYAWAKLLRLRDLGETEVGGFGISAAGDLLLIEDVSLMRQSCTSVTVKFADEAVADYFDDQVDRGLVPERFARIWIHTHPGDSPHPSRTDEETFERCFGSTDWALMFILACGGDT